MQQIISVTELRRRFRAVFDDVSKRGVAYVLTRGGRPEAALSSFVEFLRFQRLKEQDVFARYDRLVARLAEQSLAASKEEAAADVAAALAELDD
jgi:PHD/YefM family antitoxin component YafN of YafNO toxin-antitoxin module